MQSLKHALLLLVLSAPLASSLAIHQEHAWSWPWSRKAPAAKTPEPAVAADAAQEHDSASGTLASPTEPGCFMRMVSGCPKNPMRTELWRHDVWAEKKGFDEEGCMTRKAVWDGYCESQDAKMVYVSGKVSALQVSPAKVEGSPSWEAGAQWPWSKKKAKTVEATPADETAAVEAPASQQTQSLSAKVPSLPGCYMRMASGCPKEPMKTLLWRHDPSAEERGLDEAACLKRKKTWDSHCDATDAEMVFVGKAAEAEAAPAATEAAVAAAGPTENATEAAEAEAAPAATEAAVDAATRLVAEAAPAAEEASPTENAAEAAPAAEVASPTENAVAAADPAAEAQAPEAQAPEAAAPAENAAA